jgi:pyruvate dehydrogenase E1 component alpha subunit
MYTTVKEASGYARKGNGPSLIEAVTYRKGAHTTSDDPTKYRTKEEEEEWDEKDPLKRLKSYLIAKKLWSEDEEKKIVKQYKKEVERQFEEAENYPPYKLEDVFDHLYSDTPDDLKKQKVAYEKYLHWKEARK